MNSEFYLNNFSTINLINMHYQKFIFALVIVFSYSLNLCAQKKLYSINKNPKIKGISTYVEFKDKEQKEGIIAAGTIAATIGSSIFSAGVGFIEKSLSKRQELSTASYKSNLIPLETLNSSTIHFKSSYFGKKSNKKVPFQELVLTTSNLNDSSLIINISKFENDFNRVLIKKNRDFIIYELTLNGTIFYKDGNKLKERVFTSSITIDKTQIGKKEFESFPKIYLPKEYTEGSFFISIKEVNPFFMGNSATASFLSDYGESISSILSGILIEKEED
jgi:hypothetical protein